MIYRDVRNSPFGKLLFLIFLVQTSPANASPLFDDDTILEVNLTGPLSALFEEEDDRKELPFLLSANSVEHQIDVRLRGNARRRVCDFPPLRLNFASGDSAETIFAGQDKLKLVTHCRKGGSSQSDTLQEYAAYRIFNLLSDFSYKVRLLRITYSDTDSRLREDVFDRYGFLIESSSELADRMGAQPARVPGVSLGSLDSTQAATVFIFHYLIGNTDWSLVAAEEEDSCCHNGDLFDIGSVRYYVPYDFDLSGFVNPRYARPDPSLRISRVTQRLYRGYCVSTDALQGALRDIKNRRADILNEIRQLPGLSKKEIAATLKYVERFFVEADNENKLVQSFERGCL